jgi:hypothetical protein
MWLYPAQIMSNSGTALLGIGRGAGPDRAEEAIYDAINTPLLQGHAIQVGTWVCLLDEFNTWPLVAAVHMRCATVQSAMDNTCSSTRTQIWMQLMCCALACL